MGTFLTTLFPLLTSFILIVVVFMVIKVMSKKVLFKTARTSKLIIVSYIVLLSVGVLIAYLLSNPNVANEPDIDVEQVEYLEGNFHNIANNGELADTMGIYEADMWSFVYDKAQLTVFENGGNWILYEKKPENDGQIDVVRYTTKHVINGFDYTDKIEAPTVELAGNQLTISEAPQVNISVANFYKEFTITQFTGDRMLDDRNPVSGRDALVIRVPANVEIVTNQQDRVHYINE